MAGGELDLYCRIQNRDNLGRYLASIPEKARRAIEETARGAANVGRAGASVDTGAMRDSIQPVIFSDFSGGVTVGTNHWRYQNYGTSTHDIPGNVRFFWLNRGRTWTPGSNTIRHPGNPALHFMDHAADYARKTFMDAVRSSFG